MLACFVRLLGLLEAPSLILFTLRLVSLELLGGRFVALFGIHRPNLLDSTQAGEGACARLRCRANISSTYLKPRRSPNSAWNSV